MAGYKKKCVKHSKEVKRIESPQARNIKSVNIPQKRSIYHYQDPNGFYQWNPGWNFHLCDNDKWTLNESQSECFWNEILPKLKNWEKRKWQEILVDDKKLNHPIDVTSLNPVARKRLQTLEIEEESIYSLRLQGQHRLYGFINYGIFNILWFDTQHGDNDTCVCRSHKKHT